MVEFVDLNVVKLLETDAVVVYCVAFDVVEGESVKLDVDIGDPVLFDVDEGDTVKVEVDVEFTKELVDVSIFSVVIVSVWVSVEEVVC